MDQKSDNLLFTTWSGHSIKSPPSASGGRGAHIDIHVVGALSILILIARCHTSIIFNDKLTCTMMWSLQISQLQCRVESGPDQTAEYFQ